MRWFSTKHVLYYIIALGAAAALCCLAFLQGSGFSWIEFFDLEIDFQIQDAATGRPVPNAVVVIFSEVDEDCVRDKEREARLNTNEQGKTSHIWPRRILSGRTRGSDTSYSVSLPACIVYAYADGYDHATPIELMEFDQRGRIWMDWHERGARLPITIYLRKKDQ
jgi:hypothetical protein